MFVEGLPIGENRDNCTQKSYSSGDRVRATNDIQTCAALPARDQIVKCNAVRISGFHNVKQLVFDVLHVDLSAHNLQRLSADGTKEIVDVKHGEKPGGGGGEGAIGEGIKGIGGGARESAPALFEVQQLEKIF